MFIRYVNEGESNMKGDSQFSSLCWDKGREDMKDEA